MKPLRLRASKVVGVYVTSKAQGMSAVRLSRQVLEGRKTHDFVPHLHRISPDRRTLIVADVEGRNLQRLSLPVSSDMNDIDSLWGELDWSRLRTLRWLDNEYLVAHLEHDVAIITLSKEAFSAVSILGSQGGHSTIEDVRILRNGIMVRHTPNGESQHVAFISVENGKPVAMHTLNTEGRQIIGSNVLSAGRIVVALKGDAFSNGQSSLWIYRTNRGEGPSVIREIPCAGTCEIENWTPGTERLVYALDTQKIVIETPDGGETVVTLDEPGHITALWQSRDERRIVAANGRQLKVWNSDGMLLWSARTEEQITSVHFAPDDRAILVGVGNTLRVYSGAGVKNAMPLEETYFFRMFGKAMRFDDAIALPGGGHVFAVVQ